MQIEVWSDFVCPFCYIGKRKLEEALAKAPNSNHIKVTFKSFQLDPESPPYNGQDYFETLAQKFGSIEQVKQMTAHVATQAKQVGLDFNFSSMKQTNTFLSHRFAKYAEEMGKGGKATERLLQAHFLRAEDIGCEDTLVNIAGEIGLDKEKALAVIQDETAYADAVIADLNEAKQFQITGVPYFIFNRKYAISGAQPVDTFKQALQKIQEEQSMPFQEITPNNENSCKDDECSI